MSKSVSHFGRLDAGIVLPPPIMIELSDTDPVAEQIKNKPANALFKSMSVDSKIGKKHRVESLTASFIRDSNQGGNLVSAIKLANQALRQDAAAKKTTK